MSTTINPEIASLRDRLEAQGKELAEIRGSVHQLDKIIGATVRQSIWQLIALLATLLVAIGGGLVYQTNTLDKRFEQFEKRFEHVEKRFEQSEKSVGERFDQFEKRLEQSEKNILARFEDLKQEVRARKK